MQRATILIPATKFVGVVAGGWPSLDLQTALQGAPFKLRLGGGVQLSQKLSPLPTKFVSCLGDQNTFSNPGNCTS
jgi:hypothetical protein